MQNALKLILGECRVQGWNIVQVIDDQLGIGMHRLAVALGQIVIDNHIIALFDKQLNNVAANVTSATGYQYSLHVLTSQVRRNSRYYSHSSSANKTERPFGQSGLATVTCAAAMV